MNKLDLMNNVGNTVEVTFNDGTRVRGELEYTEDFSSHNGFLKPNCFQVGNYSFKVSHVKKFSVVFAVR